MSVISDLYDSLDARLAAIFPTHRVLTDSLNLEQNTELVLKKAWGLQIAAGENSNRQLACNLSVRRDIIVHITRQHAATEFNRADKIAKEKELLEDQLLVIKDFEENSSALIEDGGKVAAIQFVSDGGIETVFTDRDNFLKLTSIFSFEYFESY